MNPALEAGFMREDWVWVGHVKRRGWGPPPLASSNAFGRGSVSGVGWWVIGDRCQGDGYRSLLVVADFRLPTPNSSRRLAVSPSGRLARATASPIAWARAVIV